MQWFQNLWQFIKQHLWRKELLFKVYKVDDLPETLISSRLYVVGEGDYLWYAAMLCPCNCQAILYMNLSPDERPKWSLSSDVHNKATLKPSIWRKVGCESHFWLRDGKIYWCTRSSIR
ncbi:DUF6527 family protein [Pseudanabaena sp. SR411]|uniref:DUF6527 family protein n=1 Tax=Pseudanabaena sp. SR411 TaxID=1980935 RepID=UPI0011401DA2|nr:DUF6527 family protein [Pseudanabaena sp. SR411]